MAGCVELAKHINDVYICDMAGAGTLQTLVARVIGKVSRFFDDLCENEKQQKEFETWKQEMAAMVRATQHTHYICEENLVVLTNWRMAVSERWERVSQELREGRRAHYNTLQVNMDSIIARMQFKILLGKLAELGV